MYIGKSPQTGAYSVLDTLTASATASYVMQLNSVNYSPESAQHLIVSLNGSIQKPNSSFTCSGSTLTFSEALTSSDSIDFIYALGNVLDVGTVSDSIITNAKTNFVSTSSASGLQIRGDGTTDGTLQLNCSQNSHGIKLKSPPHSASASYTLTFPNDDGDADQVLKTNGSGVLDWTTPSSGETNTPYFKAYTSGSTQQASSGAYLDPVAFATELVDSDNAFASNIFTVPSGKAGKYYFNAQIEFYQNMYDCYVLLVKNSTNVSVARNKRQTDTSTWNMRTIAVSTILSLAVGDTMKVKVYAETSDSQYNVFASETTNYFEGFRIAT